MPYVLVQEEGGFRPLEEWFVTDSIPYEKETWNRVCTLLVRSALEGKCTPSVNVFVILDQEELANRDRPALASLIESARARTWGASLLLVLSNPPFLRSIERSAHADLAKWLQELLSGRISDLLEISDRVDRRAPDRFLGSLRDRASATDARRKTLNAIASHRAWRCVLPRGPLHLNDFLGPELIATGHESDSAYDVLMVLPAVDVQVQKAVIDRYLKGSALEARCRVITYIHEPSIELQQYCAEVGLHEPVEVRGDFELWYLLLRLNEHARVHRSEDSYSVYPVRLAAEPRLKVKEPEDVPSLLVTSVFDLGDVGQWLVAANEVGELLHRIPFGIKRRIEVGVTPERLNVLLEDISVVSVWIHIGHGEGKHGLQVPGDGTVDVEKWLHCFHGRDLRLALFLTCNSDIIAKRFAEEGASVAIGFHGDVESDKTWHLAVEIVKAIVAEGTHGGAILAGFGAGLPRFEAVQKLNAHARAYYPRQV